MNLDRLFVDDPVTKQKSVSLTLLVYTFAATMLAGALHMAGVVSQTSLFSEILYSSTALYFGRRMSISGKSFSSDKAEEISKKVDEVSK